ncbi:TonB-dependent receptor plug domain-containing protein [Parahaliea mediterranea]|uniref:TonB-dependent receptor n=1 Tax=Parahaliea mediterranea TaxID=651086 RepID=A0A939DCW6_9GAMM|nr:TonB-dependent receptor [Parahaliea mediterranea]MBN7795760.1 TonB-dependent receptor [Parahaliea mediterranea]
MGYTPKIIAAAIRAELWRPGQAAVLLGALCAAALPAQAQDVPRAGNGLPIEEIVVTGNNVYRDRTDDINPTLAYGLDFFQRFEPQTVGEMLKRTPGVVFTSDVLEYDAVQLRGLDAAYTEVLINGRPIPGQGADRTFFVDRIPSELVERIEIIRSPSADMSSQGVAGSLNIILKDGAQLEGISTRLGTTYYADDERFRGTGSVAIADAGEGYDYWLGLNVQERRNPKQKLEKYFDDGVLEGFAFEDDTRDGTDSSLNGSVGFDVPGGNLRLNGYYVYTDRSEEEFVREYEGEAVDVNNSDLVAIARQKEDIDQTSWGLDGLYTLGLGSGELALSAAISHFDEDTVNVESEEAFEDGISQGVEVDNENLDIEDDNYAAEVSYTLPLGATELKAGLAYSLNEREGMQAGFFDVEADIEETRWAPYAKLTVPVGKLSIEGGLRYDIYERDVNNEDGDASQDGDELLPSLSLRWDLTEATRLTASVARTLRRPEFDLVAPFEEDETPDDEDLTVGNPELDSETALGYDFGIEHRIGRAGIIGVNVFYRDIEDVIELTDTGVPFPDGGGSIFTPMNIGDGTARGIELDISTPLDFIGLDNTGLYANYAYLDSEIEDPFTGEERTFRNQPDYVYNISLTQDLPGFGGAGISYQKRDDSLETEFQEYVVTEYDGNLELFVEWNVTENSVLRLSGTNLLDQEKVEYIRDYGEPVNEIQIEESTPTSTLTWRSAF